MYRAVFLDLNGTLVLPLKPISLSEIRLIPKANESVKRLIENNYICPIVTVQSRIEKGLFTENEFIEWFHQFFSSYDLDVKGPYICPHRFSHHCVCEKPNPYLYELAAKQHNLRLKKSYVIGDSPQDVTAAHRFGGIGCLVKTGWAADPEILEEAKPFASFIGNSIVDAVEWILNYTEDQQ